MKNISYSAISNTLTQEMGSTSPAMTLAVVTIASRDYFDAYQASRIAYTYAPENANKLLAVMIQYFFEEHVEDRMHMLVMEIITRALKKGVRIDYAELMEIRETIKVLMLDDVYSAALHAKSIDTLLLEVTNRLNRVTFSYLKALDFEFFKA